MCARIAEAQKRLPSAPDADTPQFDDANLEIAVPDGLMERINAHIDRFKT